MPSDFSWTDFFVEAGIPPSVSAEYALVFADHRMQADMVPDLTKDVLHDLGITVMGDILAILRQSKIYMQAERRRQHANVSVSPLMVAGSRNVQHVSASQSAAILRKQQQNFPSDSRRSGFQSPQQSVAKTALGVPRQTPGSSGTVTNSEAGRWLQADVRPQTGVNVSQTTTVTSSTLTSSAPIVPKTRKRIIITKPRDSIGTEIPESRSESNRSQTTVIRQASEPESVFKRLGVDQTKRLVSPENGHSQAVPTVSSVLVKEEPAAKETLMSFSMPISTGHMQSVQRTVVPATSPSQTAPRPMVIRTVALSPEDHAELPHHQTAVSRQVMTSVVLPSASEPLAKRVHFSSESPRGLTIQTNRNGAVCVSRPLTQRLQVGSSGSVLHRLGNGQNSASVSLTARLVKQKQPPKQTSIKARLGSGKSVFSRLG